MAESEEHKFLSEIAVEFLERAASTGLYTFLENDRKKFDFGCSLQRDWTRPIIGQTLWKHEEGVDKDLRTLLADQDAELCIYIARDTVKARNLWSEGVADFRHAFADAPLYKLRPIWVPSDFDADSDTDRQTIAELIDDRLAADVLLNVILGNLNRDAVRLFISSTGRVGLDLAILYEVATVGFRNLSSLAKKLKVSPSTLPERLARLTGCGFLNQPATDASFFHASLRGRVFLELCREVLAGRTDGQEISRILVLLDLSQFNAASSLNLAALMTRVSASANDFGVDLSDLSYGRYWESDAWPPHVTRPAGFRE